MGAPPSRYGAGSGIEQALRKSEERFRSVVEAAPNAMVMINAAGRIEMVNAQAERVFGYPRAELLGQPVEMLVPQRFSGHHPDLRGLFLNDPRSRPMGAGRDLYALRKDGSEFPVEIGLNPIDTEEGMMVLSAIVDISERKHREERIAATLKEKEVLLGEIHHRVKNNLQVIHSLLDLQSAKITDKAALALLVESQNRIKSMALIHQKLYESKDFGRVDFGSFLDTLVPNLAISYSINPQVSVIVDAGAVQLPIDAAVPCGLIVNELVSNALKHGFPDGHAGTIRIAVQRGPDDTVTLSVEDTGVGIAPDIVPEQSATLGLQLVSLLADQLGARLDIRRADPTRFEVQFAVKS